MCRPRCTQLLVPVLVQLLQSDAVKELGLPSPLGGHVRAFAGEGADGACGEACGAVCEPVREIEELAFVEVGGRHVVFEPEDLGDLHLQLDNQDAYESAG